MVTSFISGSRRNNKIVRKKMDSQENTIIEGENLEKSEEEIVKMQQELEEARAKSEAANDMMLRLAAELDNYKKRTMKEQESLRKYANQNLIKEFFAVLDNLERAIASANESEDLNSLIEGVKMIFKQIYTILQKEGVNRIDAVGEKFDPNLHEAVAHIPSDEFPENTIIEELQKGYILQDRVIRPSMVVVSKGSLKDNEQ